MWASWWGFEKSREDFYQNPIKVTVPIASRLLLEFYCIPEEISFGSYMNPIYLDFRQNTCQTLFSLVPESCQNSSLNQVGLSVIILYKFLLEPSWIHIWILLDSFWRIHTIIQLVSCLNPEKGPSRVQIHAEILSRLLLAYCQDSNRIPVRILLIFPTES